MKDRLRDLKITGVHPGDGSSFGAGVEEMAAAALHEAGMLSEAATVNGQQAARLVADLDRKRRGYDEATRLGSLLVRRGILSEEELDKALALHRSGNAPRLGDALVKLHICTEDDIRRSIDAQIVIRESLSDLDDFRRKIDSIKERLRLHL